MDIILIIYLVVSIALIGIILLQQGKGAEMGASFGAGGANTVFGAAGSGNVLTKTTSILAILFFAIALTIGYMNNQNTAAVDEVLDVVPAVEQEKTATGLESEVPAGEAAVLESETPAQTEETAVKADAEKTEADKTEETTPPAAAEEQKKDDSNQ